MPFLTVMVEGPKAKLLIVTVLVAVGLAEDAGLWLMFGMLVDGLGAGLPYRLFLFA